VAEHRSAGSRAGRRGRTGFAYDVPAGQRLTWAPGMRAAEAEAASQKRPTAPNVARVASVSAGRFAGVRFVVGGAEAARRVRMG
jgi:hypothetical protein